eukprot:SAG11_NODE_15569_length_569_cov_1.687764_1_plen_57_part_10
MRSNWVRGTGVADKAKPAPPLQRTLYKVTEREQRPKVSLLSHLLKIYVDEYSGTVKI